MGGSAGGTGVLGFGAGVGVGVAFALAFADALPEPFPLRLFMSKDDRVLVDKRASEGEVKRDSEDPHVVRARCDQRHPRRQSGY